VTGPNAGTGSANGAIGGRFGRWIGAALLVHFAVVCAVKAAKGCPEEILWMSHVGLLLAGLGLVGRSTLLVCTALLCILLLHGLWVFDCVAWWMGGSFPLSITSYLEEADAWVWLGTAHHFYLAPLLVVLVLVRRSMPRHSFPSRDRQGALARPRQSPVPYERGPEQAVARPTIAGPFPAAALPAAVAVYLWLSVLSRAFLDPAPNVNYAFGVPGALDFAFFRWANLQPGFIYLPGLNLFVTLVFFLPPFLALRAWSGRGSRAPGANSLVAAAPPRV